MEGVITAVEPFAPVVHVYVSAPEAVKLLAEYAHTCNEVGVTATIGFVRVVMATVADEEQPFVAVPTTL